MEKYILVIHYGCNVTAVVCDSERDAKEVLVKCAKAKKKLFPFGLAYKGRWLWYNERFDRYGREADELMEILQEECDVELEEGLSREIFEEDDLFKEGYHDVEEFYPPDKSNT